MSLSSGEIPPAWKRSRANAMSRSEEKVGTGYSSSRRDRSGVYDARHSISPTEEGETMGYTVRTRQAPGVTGLDATVYVLEDGDGAIAEVWPALGFNCFRWSIIPSASARGGQALHMLY